MYIIYGTLFVTRKCQIQLMRMYMYYDDLQNEHNFSIGLPVPIVAVSAAISHEYYGINDRCI